MSAGIGEVVKEGVMGDVLPLPVYEEGFSKEAAVRPAPPPPEHARRRTFAPQPPPFRRAGAAKQARAS